MDTGTHSHGEQKGWQNGGWQLERYPQIGHQANSRGHRYGHDNQGQDDPRNPPEHEE